MLSLVTISSLLKNDSLDVPRSRADNLTLANLRWLSRNLAIRNHDNILTPQLLMFINQAISAGIGTDTCKHERMNAFVYTCPVCGFYCEHDRDDWSSESTDTPQAGGYYATHTVSVMCERDGVDVTSIAFNNEY